jgi:hypothetical protein
MNMSTNLFVQRPVPQFLHGPLLVVFLCVHMCALTSSSNKDTGHSDQSKTPLYLSYHNRDSITKYGSILKNQGLGFHHVNFGGTQFSLKQGVDGTSEYLTH